MALLDALVTCTHVTCQHCRRRKLFHLGPGAGAGRPAAATRKFSAASSHHEPCLTHLRDDFCDGDPDHGDLYMKHRQLHQGAECPYGHAVLRGDADALYATHTCELMAPPPDAAPDVTDVKLAGIHRSHSFSSSRAAVTAAAAGGYATHAEVCSIQDCSRPCAESVPMVERGAPRGLVRTLSGGGGGAARRSVPVETPRYFVLEPQPS